MINCLFYYNYSKYVVNFGNFYINQYHSSICLFSILSTLENESTNPRIPPQKRRVQRDVSVSPRHSKNEEREEKFWKSCNARPWENRRRKDNIHSSRNGETLTHIRCCRWASSNRVNYGSSRRDVKSRAFWSRRVPASKRSNCPSSWELGTYYLGVKDRSTDLILTPRE